MNDIADPWVNALTCGICHTVVVRTPNEDGGTFSCECGRTHGCWLNKGNLDLGVVEKPAPARPRGCNSTGRVADL